jgi:hypothetical protein
MNDVIDYLIFRLHMTTFIYNRVTHATPAALYAHSATREWECDAFMTKAAGLWRHCWTCHNWLFESVTTYIRMPRWCKFWRVSQSKMLVYFVAILVYFVTIWYILWCFGTSFPRFGMFYQETSGNPDCRKWSHPSLITQDKERQTHVPWSLTGLPVFLGNNYQNGGKYTK